LERLRAARERIGPVNLRAAAEADELRGVVANTKAEADELAEAVARLNQAIAHLNREGRERLAQVFEVVDGHFRDLFGGCSAAAEPSSG
jgi:chromosome segregation protein